MKKILICGTRGIGYAHIVRHVLNNLGPTFELIEGCCPKSADEYAEKWAKENKVNIHHFPATAKNYLKRNIDMVHECDEVIAFWDGFSYGTAHTIATAVANARPTRVILIK